MTIRDGTVDPQLDVRGVDPIDTARTLTEETGLLGAPVAGQSGAAASIVAGAAVGEARVSGLTGMTAESRGRHLTTGNVASGANAGTFLISAFVNATTVDVVNASAVIPDGNNGSITWEEREPYSLQDNIQFTQTDRAAIKGVALDAAIPTYERPDAVGTPVPANLANIAGKTTDAGAKVSDVKQDDIKLRPSISGGGANVLLGDETITLFNFHLIPDDVESFLLLSGGPAGATGVFRIKAVTDGQNAELDGLNPVANGSTSWTLLSGLKCIGSSANHADAVDRTGIPIADSGAEDETVYDATFADLIDPASNGGAVDEAGNRIFSRTFGAEKDPNAPGSPEGSRFYEQLLTGDNDGTATDSSLESIAGRSGAAASVTNGTNNVTGLTGMQSEDVGKFLTLFNNGLDGTQRHAPITGFVSATEVTVGGAAFGVDPGNGGISWQVSRHRADWDFYTPLRERCDQMPETRGRGLLIGGIVSDSELVQDLQEIRDAVGISDGVSDLSGLLTNTGAEFVFSDLPDANPSVVEALNVLNAQIGDRTYTGTILTSGETVAASLQALSDAIGTSSISRTIERRASAIPSGTLHTLPAGVSYTIDGTNNGANMFVTWRKLWRDPGPSNVGSNDYEESTGLPTVPGQITNYSRIRNRDSINYMVLQ